MLSTLSAFLAILGLLMTNKICCNPLVLAHGIALDRSMQLDVISGSL
jgi:hypothetical protein